MPIFSRAGPWRALGVNRTGGGVFDHALPSLMLITEEYLRRRRTLRVTAVGPSLTLTSPVGRLPLSFLEP